MEEVKNIANKLIPYFPIDLVNLVIDYIPAANILAINGYNVKFYFIINELNLIKYIRQKFNHYSLESYILTLQIALFHNDLPFFDEIYKIIINKCFPHYRIRMIFEESLLNFYLNPNEIDQMILLKLQKIGYDSSFEKKYKIKNFSFKQEKNSSILFGFSFYNNQINFSDSTEFNQKIIYLSKDHPYNVTEDWQNILKIQKYLIKSGNSVKISTNIHNDSKDDEIKEYTLIKATEFPYFLRDKVFQLNILKEIYLEFCNRILEVCRLWLLENFGWK